MSIRCRTCGEHIYNLNAISLFDKNNDGVLQKIKVLTGILFTNDVNMPVHICACCQVDLDNAMTFRDRCIETQKQLLNENYNMDLGMTKLTQRNWDELDPLHSFLLISDTDDEATLTTHSVPKQINRLPQTCSQPRQFSPPNQNVKSQHCRKSRTSTHSLNKSQSQLGNQVSCSLDATENLAGQKYVKKFKSLEKKSYICDQCGRCFKDSSNLKLHLIRHTGIKQYECKECHRKYISSHLLNLHIRVRHNGEMPYACKYCDKRFYTSTNRCRHERIHMDKKSFECKYCSKSFNTKSCLNKHEFLHTGQRPYRCETCDVAFQRNTNLKIHYRSKLHQKRAGDLLLNSCDSTSRNTISNDDIDFDLSDSIVNVVEN